MKNKWNSGPWRVAHRLPRLAIALSQQTLSHVSSQDLALPGILLAQGYHIPIYPRCLYLDNPMPTFSWRGNWISAAASWAHQWNLRNCCLEAARTRAKAHRSVWKVHLNIDNVCVFSIYKPLQTHTTPNALRPHESFTMWNSTSIWIFPQNKRNQQGSTTPGHLKLCCKDDPVASPSSSRISS